jgi:hypothetical protein
MDYYDTLKVICLDDNKVYDSVYDASWDKEVFVTDIIACCDGIKRCTFETHWAYCKN